MKTAIIYHSKYGHTKQYAQWLAEELNADIYESKNLKISMLDDYASLVFGGSLYAGKNKAASLIVKHFEQIKDKKVALFTCGLADVSNEINLNNRNKALDKVITPEIREKITVFHLQGGIDYDNLSFLHKMMMKMVHKPLQKKPADQLTGEEKAILETYGQKIDLSDKKMLKPIIEFMV